MRSKCGTSRPCPVLAIRRASIEMPLARRAIDRRPVAANFSTPPFSRIACLVFCSRVVCIRFELQRVDAAGDPRLNSLVRAPSALARRLRALERISDCLPSSPTRPARPRTVRVGARVLFAVQLASQHCCDPYRPSVLPRARPPAPPRPTSRPLASAPPPRPPAPSRCRRSARSTLTARGQSTKRFTVSVTDTLHEICDRVEAEFELEANSVILYIDSKLKKTLDEDSCARAHRPPVPSDIARSQHERGRGDLPGRSEGGP